MSCRELHLRPSTWSLKRPRLLVLILFCALVAPSAYAHGGKLDDWDSVWGAWAWEPLPVVCLAISAILYTTGIVRLWHSSGAGHGIARWQASCFAAGWISLFVALISPVHSLGQVLFSAHMIQHEILMLVSAPLLVLGKPAIVFLHGLPGPWARGLARFANTAVWHRFWHFIMHPFVAWLIGGLVLWIWHAPALFNATLTNEWVHALQHTSFLVSALIFWWAVIYVKDKSMGLGQGLLYLFTTALHSTLLGVLLTFATRIWYPGYSHTTQGFGLTPLEDQQLGGLIMWIPAGTVYLFAALILMTRWLRESEQRTSMPVTSVTASSILVLGLAFFLTGCEGSDDQPNAQTAAKAVELTGGDPHIGKIKIDYYGCSACHTIPGIVGADGLVGPPLSHVASRNYIGGVLQNTPDNMIQWIQDAPRVDPKTDMPDMHVSEQDARDIAGYLYTLR